MAIKTLEVWPSGHPLFPKEMQDAMDQEILRLKAAGQTSSLWFKIDGVVKRTWATREVAQEWVDFLNTMEITPESAVIVEE